MDRSRRIYILLTVLVMSISTMAMPLSDEARISLITCTPGEEIYALYGHTALRVQDPLNDIDVAFNYGIFDFNTDHFYWRFMRGETWYELGATPFNYFMREYEWTHRAVYEQTLHLTPSQRERIWQALLTNYEPQNRQYLYNFVFDNCATRPYWLIRDAIGDSLRSSYTGYTGMSYRSFIRHYTGPLSWANAGINLLFGPKADQPMNSEQRLFLPEELMLYFQQAYLSDGTPLVESGQIAPFHIASTPWYRSWPMGLAVYAIIIALISLYDRRRGRLSWPVDLVCAIPYIVLLLIVAFLTFFSCHPLVGFGWRLLIIPFTHLCARLIYIIH